ncbi:MAG: PAS domain-containing protein [Acidobacteria bacterium]|nr:PAS domain-containing protein [Acidobacteriota bacterium]
MSGTEVQRSAGGSGAASVRLEVDRLFDLVPSAISIQDRDYRIVRVNATFRRLFGDRVGDCCFAAYKGREEVCLDCPMARTFADGEIHQSEEVVRTADGEILQVAVQTAPLVDRDGGISGGMEVMTDISRTVAEQQELVLLGQAMAGMAHYIKNLLTGLDGGLYVVEEAMESGDEALLREGWEMVRRNVERVGKLSRDQLFCSRERPPEMAEIPVNPLICEAVELYRPRAVQEGTRLSVELDPRLGTGWLDAEGVHRLVTNLLSNALDACRFDTDTERHWVSVKTFLEAGGQLHLEVADNGPGIPRRLCGSVFEEMFTTKGSGGTGLGLLVVYRVVCAHGGRITVLSEEGAGTVFTVILPLTARG